MKITPNYTVIYNDDDIIVLNKRSGLLVAQDRYDPDAPRLDSEAEKEFGRLYAVHRIDKDTSGCVIYAKNADSHRALSMQFENRTVEKIYHCLVNGRPLWQTKTVDSKLLPDGDFRHRTTINSRFGKTSITDFKLIGICGPYSWLEARPKTGRTHQIRVHLKALKATLYQDFLYNEKIDDKRLTLQCYFMKFLNPENDKVISFKSNITNFMLKYINLLELSEKSVYQYNYESEKEL